MKKKYRPKKSPVDMRILWLIALFVLAIFVIIVFAASPSISSPTITLINGSLWPNSSLMGNCSASDSDSDNVSYDARWYINDTLYYEFIPEYISAGYYYSCGILTNGSAYCWGMGSFGGLGYGGTSEQDDPKAVNVSALTTQTFKSISSGYEHSCGILTNGSVYCWGNGTYGQLGYGGTTQQNNPIAVNISSSFKSISSGSRHSCGILTNGSAYCWGNSTYGQIGYGGTSDQYNPIAVNISTSFRSISSGYYFTCGILTNGSVYCWGQGTSGQLGYGGTSEQDNPNAVNVSALTTQTFKSISSGYYHTCGILTNGSAYCWGNSTYGQIGYGGTSNQKNPKAVNVSALTTQTFKSISSGYFQTCGILTNGSAYCWGMGDLGQLGYGDISEQNNPKAVNTTGLSSPRFWPFFTQGVTNNIDNITYELQIVQTWNFECRASDNDTYSSWMNSSDYTLDNITMNFSTPTDSDNYYTKDRNWTQINISIDTYGLDSFKFNWNGTNYTFYDSSLIMSLNFNNNSAIGDNYTTATDTSKYGNSATLKGSALKFDGSDDYVNISTTSSLNITNNISVELWLYATSSVSYGKLIGTYNGNLSQSSWLMQYSPDNITWFVWTSGQASATSSLNISENLGKWIHIVGTYDKDAGSNNLKLYINGQSNGVATQTGSLNGYNVPVTIGAYRLYDSTIHDFFNGTIDEVRIYNRSLSAAEVLQHYNGNFSDETGLVLYIPFMNASGTTATDFSGKGNSGTLIGFSNTSAAFGDTNTSGWTTYGRPLWTSNGKYGSALNFNGIDDYVSVIPSSSINSTTKNLTVMAWVKTNSNSINQNVVAAKNNFFYRLRVDGTSSWWFLIGNDSAINMTTSPIGVSLNAWTHIAATFNGDGITNTTKLYQNGVLVASQNNAISTIGTPNQNYYIIGEYYDGGGEFFNGSIDEIRIWNRSLNASEMFMQYQSEIQKYNASQYRFYDNVSNLSYGSYNYSGWGNTTISSANTSTRSFSYDNVAPTGGSIIYPNINQTTTSLTVNLSNGTDAISGINSSFGTIFRQNCTMSGNTCDPSANPWGNITSSTYTTSAYTDTLTTGYCYKYIYQVRDNVLNEVNYTNSSIVCVDTSAPSCSVNMIVEEQNQSYQYVLGNTIFYNNATGGNFSVNVTAADSESGVNNVTFPVTTSSGSSDTTSPYNWTYSWTTSSTFNNNATITSYNKVGGSQTCQFNVTQDTAQPSGGYIRYPNINQTTTSMLINISNGTDSGAGINSSFGTIFRQNCTMSGNTCTPSGTWLNITSSSYTTSNYTDTLTTGYCYEYIYQVRDNVLNEVNYTNSSIVCVDTSAPSCSFSSFTEVTNPAYQYNSGSTIYYNNATTGAFNVTITSTDSESGTHNVTFPTATSAGGADTTSPYEYAYTWATSSTYSSSSTATAYNKMGGSQTCTFTVTLDNVAPTGGSLNYTNGTINTTTISVNYSYGTDATSGVNSTSGLIERKNSPLVGNSCTGYGSWANITARGASTTYSDTTAADANCYQYRINYTDYVNNTALITSTNETRVDAMPPNCTGISIVETTNASYQYVSGSIIYYNNASGGEFTITPTVADYSTTVSSVAYPTTVSAGGTNSTSPFSMKYAWTGASTFSSAVNLNVTDIAGNRNVSACSLTITKDTAQPSGGYIRYPNINQTTTSLTLNLSNGTDTSGVNGTFGTIFRQNCTMSGNTCDPSANPWGNITSSTYTTSAYTDTLTTGYCYKYIYQVRDNVLNEVNYTNSSIVCVDTSAPSCSFSSFTEVTNPAYQYNSGSTIYYNNATTGAFNVTITSTDSESGTHNVTFPTATSAGGADTTSPYEYAYTWATSSTYSSSSTATAYNKMGGSQTCTFTVTLDNVAPTGGSITYTDGIYTSTSVPITYTNGTDASSGLNVSTGKIQRRNATLAANSCGSYSAWSDLVIESDGSYADSTVSSGYCYQYQYNVSDYVINWGNYSSSNTAKIDTSAPTQSTLTVVSNKSTDPSGWSTTGSVNLSWTQAADAETTIDHYEIWRNCTPFNTTKGEQGCSYTLIYTTSNNATLNYTDTGRFSNTTYYYKITSVSLSGLKTNSTQQSIQVDTDNPGVTITYPTASTYIKNLTINVTSNYANTYNVNCNATHNGTSTWYDMSGDNIVSGTANYSMTVDSSGIYTFTVKCWDQAGLITQNNVTNVNLDTIAPITTDNSTSAWSNSNQVVRLTCTDGNGIGCSNVTYCIDTTGTCTPFTVASIASGTYDVSVTCSAGSTCQNYVRYYSNDTLNNTETPHNSNLVRIDNVPPTLNDIAVNSTSISLNESVRFNATISDDINVSGVKFNIQMPNGTTINATYTGISGTQYWVDCNQTSTICKTNITGQYNLTSVWVNDTANNIVTNSSPEKNFNVYDTVSPTISEIGIDAIQIEINYSARFNATVTDDYSGVGIVKFDIQTPGGTYDIIAANDSATHFYVICNSTNTCKTGMIGQYNLTSISANDTVNNMKVNNSPAKSFFVGGGNISQCLNLEGNNTVYNLTSDVSSTGTCMNILGNNVTLNCKEYSISYSSSQAGFGIYDFGYENATIMNCHIIQNSSQSESHAIYTNASYAVLSWNNISVNGSGSHGIYLYSDSDNNTIANSSIYSKFGYSIYLNNSGSKIPSGNIIYNNLLNSTIQVGFSPSTADNFWNITLRNGVRIAGNGIKIGGNYYTNPVGSGYSDTCADIDEDGFCDQTYDIITGTNCTTGCGNNADYLPMGWGAAPDIKFIITTDNGGKFQLVRFSTFYNATAPGNINDGNWHHLVATFNGTAMKLYVDGSLKAVNTSYTGSIPKSTSGIRIGTDYNNTPGKFFNGTIENIRILNYTLSDSEIYDDYIKGTK